MSPKLGCVAAKCVSHSATVNWQVRISYMSSHCIHLWLCQPRVSNCKVQQTTQQSMLTRCQVSWNDSGTARRGCTEVVSSETDWRRSTRSLKYSQRTHDYKLKHLHGISDDWVKRKKNINPYDGKDVMRLLLVYFYQFKLTISRVTSQGTMNDVYFPYSTDLGLEFQFIDTVPDCNSIIRQHIYLDTVQRTSIKLGNEKKTTHVGKCIKGLSLRK